MDPSLPVLVTLLPDQRALARLLKAALRHEVAEVALEAAPRQGTHTLDLRIGGSPAVSLLAELAGAPQNGNFPLRLRPLHRAQAAELYALLEAENPASSENARRLDSAPPGTPAPDTEAPPRTLALEADSAPIARAMVGSAPPPVAVAVDAAKPAAPAQPLDAKGTARLDWGRPGAASRPPPPGSIGRTTARSLEWTPPKSEAGARASRASMPATGEIAAAGGSRPSALPPSQAALPRLPDDPRRTARSVAWDPAPVEAPGPAQSEGESEGESEGAGADAEDPSLSVSVVFEPDRNAAAAAAAPAHDDDEPSLSVSVVFEPDAIAAVLQGLDGPDASGDASPSSVEVPFSDSVIPDAPEVEAAATRDNSEDITSNDVTEAVVGGLVAAVEVDAAGRDAAASDDFFFDEALANLPMVPADVDEAAAERPLSEGPSTEGLVVPSFPASSASDDHDDDETIPPPNDDDDDDATLIRLPGAPAPRASVRPAPAPAAAPGAPVADDVRARIVSDDARAPEELTPTHTNFVATPRKKSTTGLGRKKKPSRQGKPSDPGTGRGKRKTRHPADAEADTSSAKFDLEELATAKKAKAEQEQQQHESDEDPLIGRKIADGKYEIESLIGAGAAGAVYKARHRELRRTVAIKFLHPHYQQDPHFMKSFRGEALAASQLDHPNVMRVLDFGQEPDGLVYIVMEFLSGRTLQSLLDEERRLQTDRAVEIMIQVCAALSVAHDNGIIHRDIKPDNIMLVPSRNDEGGTFELVKVCDFGIAALQNPRAEDAELGVTENVIAGTPEYMSPEQARGAETDARSDVYACGMCLYELVTGRPPFIGDNAAEILIKQLEEAPRPPSQLTKGLDSLLEEIILRAIQKDRAKRQQSARELRVELKEIIDPTDAGGIHDEDEPSIVENVPVLDDPGSGFAGFFIALSSAVLRFGRFERGHPESGQAMKELSRSTRSALRGRREITFARRDAQKTVGFCVVSGNAEIVDLRRLLGSQIHGSFAEPFIEALVKKGIASFTLREGIPDAELHYIIEMLLGPHGHEELHKELLGKPLRYVSMLFLSDVVGRDRKLTWKVGLCLARLARDLRALSNVRGISLKKMREIREDLVTGIAHLLTKGDEVRQFMFNADLVDEVVANLRGFSGFQLTPLLFDRILHEPCADAVALLLKDLDHGTGDRTVVSGYLRAFAARLVGERSPKSDAVVAELYRRQIVADADVPRDLKEQIRAASLAEALVRDPAQFLRTLDFVQDPEDYNREMATLEAAMAELARRGEASALLAAMSVLARHAKGGGKPGGREGHALRTMKSMIDKQRLVPIANALLAGPPHQREAARHLIVLAGSAGAQALFVAREALTDPAARPLFVGTFREMGPAVASILGTVLPRVEVHNDRDIAFVEDLLRSVPDRLDPALGEAVAKFLAHPRLRPTALSAIVPLWGDRARKPLLDALEFAEEPARIVAISELRRIRGVDEQVVNVIERFLTMKGSASEELRVAAATALADVAPAQKVRAIAMLGKGIEGKRGLVAMIRGDGGTDESVFVTEAMARALLALDRAEGTRAVKARIARSEGMMRARLAALLSQG